MKKFSPTMLLACLILVFASPPLTTAQQTPEKAKDIIIFSIQNSDATHMREMIHELLGGELRLIVDSRTNSLLLTADKQQADQIRSLIERLDVPDSSSSSDFYSSYEVKNADVKLVYEVLQSMLAGRSLKMDFDEKTNRIHMYASQKIHDYVREILKKTDVENLVPNTPVKNVFVSLSLVVEAGQVGQDRQSALKHTTPEINAVLDEAAALGLIQLENPKLACRVVTQVQCGAGPLTSDTNQQANHRFRVSGSNASSGYRVHQQGAVHQSGDQFQIRSDIEINSPEGGSQTLATDVFAPLNHPVVLSVSSIEGVDSVVIIKLVSAK